MEKGHDELLRLALAHLHVGVIVVDGSDEVVYVNPAAERIRSVSGADIVGRSVLGCHPSGSHERVRRALQFLRTGKGKPFTRMVTNKEADRHWENTYTPIHDAEGNYAGAAVVSHDITDRRRLEEERSLNAERLQRQVADMSRTFHDLLMASMASLVAALEAKDEYSAGHSLRVAAIASKMAEHRWGFSPQSREVEMAGRVHDIGKVGIRESILGKPDRLTEDEFRHIREHPVLGERILSPVDHLGGIAKLVRHHHERFDGRGYPDGLKGEDVPDGARILAIADTFDAMTTARPYRSAISLEIAVAEVERNLGLQFDPVWGRLFLDLYRSGSLG